MQSKGVALVITLIALAVFSALGLSLLLTTSSERLTGSNYGDAVNALNSAEAALELAARELAVIPDWNPVLLGTLQSRLIDGPPSGSRAIASARIDLTTLTNELACDRPTLCSDANLSTSTAERPWGSNNPRWRPFVYGSLSALTAAERDIADAYVIVWIGDDARELDGNPLVDGGSPGLEGRDVVRAYAESFTPNGTRRAVEADLVRPCQQNFGVRTCGLGIRVQSWRVRGNGVP
jgi:hypothetical protein